MMRYSEKRGDERIDYRVPVLVEDLADGFVYRARMVNYSKRGMYLETDVILELGSEIYIEVEDPPYTGKRPQYFRAKITWQREFKDNLFTFGYGVAILSAGDVKSIQAKDIQAKQDLRKYPRKPCSKPIFIASENQYCTGLITNISRGGIFIKSRGNFIVGQLIKVVIKGNKTNKSIMLIVEVIHLSQTGIGLKYKSLLKGRHSLRDRGGTRTGIDRRKMFTSEHYPEKRSGKDRRKGGDRRLKYLKNRRGINLSGAFRKLD
jgi:Tfp pilus assembly protein PilZ